MILDKIKTRGEDMSVLEGHDRLQYIIDEARMVEPLKDKFKTDENKIRGCVSNLWVTGKVLEDGTMSYKHDAESFITKGTAKIIFAKGRNIGVGEVTLSFKSEITKFIDYEEHVFIYFRICN